VNETRRLSIDWHQREFSLGTDIMLTINNHWRCRHDSNDYSASAPIRSFYHLDQAPMNRIRAQIVSNITAETKDPHAGSEAAWMKAIYGDHRYSRRLTGTLKSLAAATKSDLKALHNRVFARGNFVVGVTGAIDARSFKRAQLKNLGIDYIYARKRLTQTITVEDLSSTRDGFSALMILGPPLKGKKG